jgi:hypothetical protein
VIASGAFNFAGFAAGRCPNWPGFSVNSGVGDCDADGDPDVSGDPDVTPCGALPHANPTSMATKVHASRRVRDAASVMRLV